MITITIDGQSRTNRDIEERWISERYRAAAENGRMPCVQVTLDTSDCKFSIATESCGRGGGGGRALNEHEKQVVALWQQSGMGEAEFPLGHIIRFFKQVQQYC